MERQNYDYSAVENRRKMETSIKFQLLIVACINIGQIIVGYSVGWSAPIIPKLQDPNQSPLPEAITDLQASWVGSLLYIGAMIGPYATAILSNLVGRKPCLFIGSALNIMAYIMVVTTNNIAMIFALRVISGLGMGITIVGNIVYVGEIASTHIRGILLTSTSIMGITGTLIVYAVVPYVSYVATGYIALAICLVHVAGIFFIPESPVYYAMKGETIKATKTLNLLGRSNDVDRILDAYCKEKSEETTKIQDWIEIFTYKSNRKSLFITFLLGAFQQTSGVAVVLFFATTIFDMAGSTIDPDIATIIIGVTRLISGLIAPLFVERSGRKILLLISMAACSVSLSVLGVYFHLDKIKSPVTESIGWLPLVALIVYFFCYEAGFGTIPNAIVGEMFRPNVRANGSALAITMTWLVGFGLTTGFNSMVETLGGDVTFWLFGGSCIVAFFFVLFCLPETKGKTLKEIQDIEWYSYHFPELVSIVPDNHLYSKCAEFIKDRKTLSEESLEPLTEILGDSEKAQAIIDASKMSMGMDISPVDLINIQMFAGRVIGLSNYRKQIAEYLHTKMNSVAPNLTTLVGDQVGARLISKAGSLTSLAKYPASTLQILGIRHHFHSLIKGLTLKACSVAQLGLGHSYSRARVKFNVHRVDNMIIQSIALLDQLDKNVNTFSMRIRMSGYRTQLWIVACVNIGQFIDGYSVGWSAPIIPKLQDPEQTPLPELITDWQVSWIGSLLYVGAIVGPYIPSYLSNIVGRKPCLFLGGLLNMTAIILIVTTRNVAMVFAIRIISGLGMGMVTVSNLVYVGEIASTKIRGILLTSTSIVGISGTLAAYAIGPFVSYAATGYIVLIINIVHLIGILFIPESPVYYAIKGKETEAKETLRNLGRLDDLDNVFEAVKGTSPDEGHSWKAWIKIFTVKANRRSLFITLSLCTLQQTSGVAAVLFFATTIFQIAGSSIRPDLATIIIGVTRLIASMIAPMVVERAGRRILLLVSTAFCACSLSILGTYFYLSRIKSPAISEVGWLPLLALIMYFFSYEIGFGTMPSALVGEMFKGNARSTGSAISMTTAWLIGFGVASGFGSMVRVVGGDVTFGIFACSCVAAFLFTYKFVPETKGRTLNEIQQILAR